MNLSIEDRFLEDFNSAHNVVFLTGAGVSTDSGIPDFQTVDRNWTFPVSRSTATSIDYFRRNPKSFWAAYRYLFDLKSEVTPNRFHQAVAKLEATKNVSVLTQNIDGLHSKAGSTLVKELHGNILWTFCSRPSCPNRVLLKELSDEAPRCNICGKYLRPDVVLFGEIPRDFEVANELAMEADMLIVAGTALDVSPVSEIPRQRQWYYPERSTVWVNKDAAPSGYIFNHRIQDSLENFSALLEKASSL